MNFTLANQMDQIINLVSERPLKRYKFTFIHDGDKKERITKGESLVDAKKALGYYFPGDITFLGWKEL